MPNPKLTKEKRDQVVRLLRRGDVPLKKIAKLIGVSNGLVSEIRQAENIPTYQQTQAQKKHQQIHDELQKGTSIADTARKTNTDRATVRKMAAKRLQDPVQSAIPELNCPEPNERPYSEFEISMPGKWLVISDLHVPYHDRRTVELAIERARRDQVVGVILNGDFLDSHEISDHDKDPTAPRYVEEIDIGKKMLAFIRAQLPNARIVFKEGNHDDRIDRYIVQRAPALFGLEGLNVNSLLHFANYGVEEVRGKRVIKLGKLHIVHGHEYKGGGGVNPARWLYLRARSMALTSHFHRTSEHLARDISQKYEAAWSIGCACHLSPAYAPLNEWNHGFAIIELASDGTFSVQNKIVLGGKLL